MTETETLRNEYGDLRYYVLRYGSTEAREAAEMYCLGVFVREMQR
jgi:hypothetical protein